MASLFGLRLGELEVARAHEPADAAARASIRQPSWTYLDDRQLRLLLRTRSRELVLGTLEGLLGEQTMARVMRTYHERWRFGHPSSDDFYAVASEVSGRT